MDPLEDQIPEPELRRLYARGSLKQRHSIARQRLADPSAEPNRVVTAVAALEGFARAVAVSYRAKSGESVEASYSKLKLTRPLDLLRDYIAPSLDGGEGRLGTPKEWETLKVAIDFRNLLVHEATFLHGGTARHLEKCAVDFFDRLAEAVGVTSR